MSLSDFKGSNAVGRKQKIESCGRPCSTVYESQSFGYRVFGMIM